jgi:hypothetical protein
MNADESARRGRVSDTRELPRDNETGAGDAQLGREVRELVRNLMRDVLGVLATASATEIGVLLARTGDVSLKRAAAKARVYGRNTLRHVEPAHSRSEDFDRKAPAGPADPFDITSPSELLASPDEILPQAPEAPSRDLSAQPPTPIPIESRPARDSSTALRDADADAASERRPKVVLREGERLLSATGSGIVIRRERRIAPKE